MKPTAAKARTRRAEPAAAAPITDKVVIDLKTDKQLIAETTALETRAAGITVDSVESAKAAKMFLSGVQSLRRKIEAHYAEIKRPLNDMRNKVLEMEKRDLVPLTTIERRVSGIVYDFESAEERRRRQAAQEESERRMREEADRRAREEQILRDQAASAKNKIDKAALTQQAQAVAAAPLPIPVVAVTSVREDAAVEGMHARTTYRGEVVDIEAFVKLVVAGKAPLMDDGKPILLVSPTWLTKVAKLGPELERVYPGLRAVPNTSYVSRG